MKDVGEDLRLAVALGNDENGPRDPDDRGIERHPGDVRLDVGRRRHAKHDLGTVERRGTREYR